MKVREKFQVWYDALTPEERLEFDKRDVHALVASSKQRMAEEKMKHIDNLNYYLFCALQESMEAAKVWKVVGE